jgi:hypothetical protein
VQTFNLVGCRKGCLEEHRAHNVVNGMNHALNFNILRRCVRTQHTEMGAMGEEDGPSQ